MSITQGDPRLTRGAQPPNKEQERQIPQTTPANEAARGGTARPACGTPPLPSSPLHFLTFGFWDRRDFTYAFGNGPGVTSNPPGPTQTLPASVARAAVERAFATWSKATSPDGKPIQLRFKPAKPGETPDIFVEWRPESDTHQRPNPSPPPDTVDHTLVGLKAHADFPPGFSAFVGEPTLPIPVHFNDDAIAPWTDPAANPSDPPNVEAVALHEIGHVLGLQHTNAPPAVMENVDPTRIALELDDRRGIDDIYSAPGPERFNFIWMEGTMPRQAAWGLTRDELRSEVDRQADDGFEISRVNAYVLPTGTLYNAIFEKLEQERHYVTDRSRENFDEQRAKWEGQGLRLIDVNAFVNADGAARFNGVWARNDVDMQVLLDLSLGSFVVRRGQLQEQNYRPVLVNAYETPDGAEGWNGIFVKQGALGDPVDWWLHQNFPRSELLKKAREHEDDGYIPVDMNVRIRPDGKGELWNGIWERRELPHAWAARWVKIDAERRTTNLEKDGVLQPWMLNAYVLPPKPTTTTQIATLEQAPVGQQAVVVGLAVDERHVYAGRYDTSITPPHPSSKPGVLVVLDRQTLQPVPELPQFPGMPRGVPVGFQPRSVAVNPVTRKIYVTNYGKESYSLSVVDGNTLKAKTIKLGQVPIDVAVNTALNRVYVSNPYQGLIHVIDGATDQLLDPIKIGPGAQGLTVDETTHTLYVAIYNPVVQPHTNGLGVVIDAPDHREILPLVPISPIWRGALDVAVDPEDDRIYVVCLGNAEVGPPSVNVYQRASLALLATIPLPKAIRHVALDSDAREVYVTCDNGNVYVIDATTLTVDRAIPAGPWPWGIATAGGTARQVFVCDRKDGSIRQLS